MSRGSLTEACRCPLCHEDLGPLRVGRLVCCGTCNTPYHRLCYRELGGCATLGCANRRPRPTLRVRRRASRDVDRPERRRNLREGLGVVSALAVVLAGYVGWQVLTAGPWEPPPAPTAQRIKQDGPRPWEQLELRKQREALERRRAAAQRAEAADCVAAGHEVGCRHAQRRPRFALTAPVDDRLPSPR